MAKDWEVVGYEVDGVLLCVDCALVGSRVDDDDAFAIFAGSEAHEGDTCEECGAEIVEGF